MARRERIHTGTSTSTSTSTRYARRDERGRFTSSEDVGGASGADQQTPKASPTRTGQGDRGDRPANPSGGH
jgi:hypothetical protein